MMRSFYYTILTLTLFSGMAISTNGQAQTTVTFQQGVNGYTGTVDGGLRQHNPNTHFGSGDITFIDWPNPTDETHGLLRFDNTFGNLSGQVPSGSTIMEATLSLYTPPGRSAEGHGGKFHRMLQSWRAADTWNIWGNGIQSNELEAKNTFNAQVGNSSLTPLVLSGPITLDVTTDIRAWANGTANYGWAVLPWANGNNGWAYATSEYNTVSQRPLLTIRYAVVPAPSGLVVLFTGAALCVGLLLRRLRK